jgi:hypothetical protein
MLLFDAYFTHFYFKFEAEYFLVYFTMLSPVYFLHSRLNYYIGFKSMKHRMINKIHEINMFCV